MPKHGEYCRYLHEHKFEQLLKAINVPANFLYENLLSLEKLVIEHAIEPSFLGDNSHSLNIHKAERYGDFNIESLVYANDRDGHISESKIDLAEFSKIVKNSDKRRVCSIYFNYSTAYIFIEVLSYGGIDKMHYFLHPDKCRPILIERFKKVYERWRKEGLLGAFDKLSYYITAISILAQKRDDLSNEEHLSLYRELPRFIANKINYSVEQMEEDMEKLIDVREGGLFKELNKNCSYKPVVELLRRDVYFLYHWICAISEKDKWFYFKNKWLMPDDWQCYSYPSFLSKVLNFEDFELKDIFLCRIPLYIENINERIVPKDENQRYGYLSEIYERLVQYDEFKPWNRAFKELHKSLCMNGYIDFRQTKSIDYLLIITIRTEILIGSICGCDDRDIKKILINLRERFNAGTKCRALFCHITNRDILKKTRLDEKPGDMFVQIESETKPNGWSDEQFHCFKSILKFVTARNYFAHHCYKDDEINKKTNDTAGKIITSCIETIFIIDKATRGQCFL